MANYLVISDLQIPFEHERALEFCFSLKRHYKIPDENVLNVGDELDLYHGSHFQKDPDAGHTPTSELRIAREKLKEWARLFPKMKICISNHGIRWVKKAIQAEIPTQLLRGYKDIYEIPESWEYKEEWVFKEKHPFRMIHGMGYSGQAGHRTAALDGGISTVMGHLHSHAGICHIKTSHQKIWGFNTGSLIDADAYAFNYGRDSRFKPCIGAGLIFGDGSTPIWVPLE